MASSGTMVDAPRSGASARPPEPVASRTAYDEVDRTHTSRVAHQDVYDRAEERTAPAQAGVSAKAAAPRGTVKGETQSERDVRLLAAREKQDRARARARAAEASDATRTKSGT